MTWNPFRVCFDNHQSISYRFFPLVTLVSDLAQFVYQVRRKDFWLLSTVTKLLTEFIPRLSHDAGWPYFSGQNLICVECNLSCCTAVFTSDIMLQGWDDPYVPRTHEGLLKWKYARMNSVDFLFEVTDDRQLLFLYERGKKKLMEGNSVKFEELYGCLTQHSQVSPIKPEVGTTFDVK
ncbi:hypothetical protein Patl1_31709 [Pistacia atlantica]|uniref:Uncharacterized protein n=1 Tax=Pistacia atlantica TaxID=434234 RepID=A0ACC1APU4_9ROSI|nr:hypothetical protein Patl1_31709 [Pistacia atlantica]